ncbi:hypothetical protein [Streptomyces sp. NPDC048639]|uniref:hypothetical protein n=1 Tax=Streptomyces sp. NPDC048639 TaxID=3365581 RepID=UPI0037172767
MASIRTVRGLAALASLPLAAALFTGVAQAENGPSAGDGSNASTAALMGSGASGRNSGNSTTVQQVSTGAGASNQNSTASVKDAESTTIDQSTHDVSVYFSRLK